MSFYLYYICVFFFAIYLYLLWGKSLTVDVEVSKKIKYTRNSEEMERAKKEIITDERIKARKERQEGKGDDGTKVKETCDVLMSANLSERGVGSGSGGRGRRTGPNLKLTSVPVSFLAASNFREQRLQCGRSSDG